MDKYNLRWEYIDDDGQLQVDEGDYILSFETAQEWCNDSYQRYPEIKHYYFKIDYDEYEE